jgi:hypothetical protein
MPVQIVTPTPTIGEIERELRALECKYGISTPAFISAEGRLESIDEDDAVEWAYLVEQFECLRDAEVKFSYSQITGDGSLKNCDSAMDRLAA